MPKKLGDHVAPKIGAEMLFQYIHQLTPAWTKKAPDKNLQTSVQNILFLHFVDSLSIF